MTDIENHNKTEDEESAGFLNRLLTFLLFSRRGVTLTVSVIGLAVLMIVLPVGTRRSIVHGFTSRPILEALLVAFILVTLSLLWTAGEDLDAWLFVAINQRWYRRKWMDRAMFWITQIGNGVFEVVLAILVFFGGLRTLALQILIGGLSLWIMVESVKALTERSRPFKSMEEVRVIGWHERGHSFPSGHTAQTFFMIAILSHHFEAGLLLNVALYTVAVLVGFSRIYIGMHYPRDVLGGAMAGSVWSILMVIAEPHWALWRG
jgi:membrane-associated phospholipid phosphatase